MASRFTSAGQYGRFLELLNSLADLVQEELEAAAMLRREIDEGELEHLVFVGDLSAERLSVERGSS